MAALFRGLAGGVITGALAVVKSDTCRAIAVNALENLQKQVFATGNNPNDPLPEAQKQLIMSMRPSIQASLAALGSPFTFDLTNEDLAGMTKGAWSNRVMELIDAIKKAEDEALKAVARGEDSPDNQRLQSAFAAASATWPELIRKLSVSQSDPGTLGSDASRRRYAAVKGKSGSTKVADGLGALLRPARMGDFAEGGKRAADASVPIVVGASKWGGSTDSVLNLSADGADIGEASSDARKLMQEESHATWAALSRQVKSLNFSIVLNGGLRSAQTGGPVAISPGVYRSKSAIQKVWDGSVSFTFPDDTTVPTGDYTTPFLVAWPDVAKVTQSAVTETSHEISITPEMAWAVEAPVGDVPTEGWPGAIKDTSPRSVSMISVLCLVDGVKQDALGRSISAGGSVSVKPIAADRFELDAYSASQGRQPALDNEHPTLDLPQHFYRGTTHLGGAVDSTSSVLVLMFPNTESAAPDGSIGMYFNKSFPGGTGRMGTLTPSFNDTCAQQFGLRTEGATGQWPMDIRGHYANLCGSRGSAHYVQRLRRPKLGGNDIAGAAVPYMALIKPGTAADPPDDMSARFRPMTQAPVNITYLNAKISGAAADSDGDVRAPIEWTLAEWIRAVGPNPITWGQFAVAINDADVLDGFVVSTNFLDFCMTPTAPGVDKRKLVMRMREWALSNPDWLVASG